MSQHTPGFNTLAIHAGAKPDPATGARATPIYQTTSYVFDDADHAASLFGLKAFGNIYTRIMNPTQAVLEERVAALEGGTAALAVASGHARAVPGRHTLLRPGENFLVRPAALRRLDQPVRQRLQELRLGSALGRRQRHLDLREADRRARPSSSSPKASPIRTASSSISKKLADLAHKHGIPLVIDNTLATPYLVRPIEHGADIVVHSLTKFIGGHGNSIGGVIVDGGTFDWSKSGKYPMLSQPRPEYGGIVLHETFGNFAFAIACARARPARLRPGDLAVQRVPDPDRPRKPCRSGCSATATTL